MQILETLDSENADRDLTTQVTVLTHTPSPLVPVECQVYVKMGDGSKNLAGVAGDYELVVTVGGQTIQPSPTTATFNTAVRSGIYSVWFCVPANEEVVAKLTSPNAGDSDVDTTAYLFSRHAPGATMPFEVNDANTSPDVETIATPHLTSTIANAYRGRRIRLISGTGAEQSAIITRSQWDAVNSETILTITPVTTAPVDGTIGVLEL